MIASKLQKTKLKLSLRSTLQVIRLPEYLSVAILTSFFMAGLIIWSLNLDLLAYIFFQAPIDLFEKIRFFLNGYTSIVTNITNAQSSGIALFSILFGVNTALIIYVLRRRGLKAIPKKSGSGAFVLAIISGGCFACGTSLLAPLLATLGATSGSFVRSLGTLFNWLGSILLAYSIYKLSHIAATIQAKERLDTVD
jgi:hypothetical protein